MDKPKQTKNLFKKLTKDENSIFYEQVELLGFF